MRCGDFPGGPVVGTLPSNEVGAGLIPGWGARIPHASWPKNQNIKTEAGTSLVVQWLRICLPMQGTRVRSLVQEDPTCRGATKLVYHNQ